MRELVGEEIMGRIVSASLMIALSAAAGAAQTVIFEADFDDGTPGMWSAVAAPPATSFRVSDVDLRDPHFFVDLIGCHDVTDTPYLVVPAINAEIAAALTGDSDGDGFIDASPLLRFRPFEDPADGLLLELTDGDCTTPSSCVVAADAVASWTAYDRGPGGPCLEAEPGTTSGYSPPVPAPAAPCLASRLIPASFDIAGASVPLEGGRLAATVVAGSPQSMTTGLLRGFLPEAVADTILIDFGIGSIPLSALLPGGTGCCAAGDDRDLVEGVMGWWFYLEFTAEEISLPGE